MTTHYKDYKVTLNLRVSTTVTFARENEEELKDIILSDAIENAIGSLPSGVEEALGGWGFELALPIDGEATEII